jgi:hypothetical protein
MEPEPTKPTASEKLVSSVTAAQKTTTSDEDTVESKQKMDIQTPEVIVIKEEYTKINDACTLTWKHVEHPTLGYVVITPYGLIFP